MNKTAENNRKKIEKALFRAMKITPIEEISVSQICKDAGISRTAFYHHYSKIDDVLLNAYEDAHEAAFGSHEWTVSYLTSDVFISDIIRFFDENSELIYALHYWNLLGSIAALPTKRSIVFIEQSDDELLRKYPMYTMMFFWTNYFTVCMAWLRDGKKETPQEMIQLMKHMKSFH